MKRVLLPITALALTAGMAFSQDVISARSGLIHFVEGNAFAGNKAVGTKPGNYPELKENEVLRTDLGRVEMLLTPGSFLRVGENSAVRMITNRLVDTRVEFVSGSAVAEVDEISKDYSVTFVYKDTTVRPLKKGVYRLDGSPAILKVFEGQAVVERGGQTVEVREGRMVSLDGELAAEKFDKDETDALDRWSRRRAEYVSLANLYAARSASRRGTSYMASRWVYNPYFGMYTFLPYGGICMSPYGYRFWSVRTIHQAYQPQVHWTFNREYGYHTAQPTFGGYSGVMASAPSAPAGHAPTSSAASAPSAPISRGSGGNAGGGRR